MPRHGEAVDTRRATYMRTFPSASSSSLCVFRLAACSRSSAAMSCLLISCSFPDAALDLRNAASASSACLPRVSATSLATRSASVSTLVSAASWARSARTSSVTASSFARVPASVSRSAAASACAADSRSAAVRAEADALARVRASNAAAADARQARRRRSTASEPTRRAAWRQMCSSCAGDRCGRLVRLETTTMRRRWSPEKPWRRYSDASSPTRTAWRRHTHMRPRRRRADQPSGGRWTCGPPPRMLPTLLPAAATCEAAAPPPPTAPVVLLRSVAVEILRGSAGRSSSSLLPASSSCDDEGRVRLPRLYRPLRRLDRFDRRVLARRSRLEDEYDDPDDDPDEYRRRRDDRRRRLGRLSEARRGGRPCESAPAPAPAPPPAPPP